MTELLTSPLFAITAVLAAYQLALWLYEKSNRLVWLHPTISGALLVAALLVLLDIDYHRFSDAAYWLTFWLGPATVALAIPLYQQWHLIRKMAGPLLLTLIAGAAFACLSAVAIAWYLGGSETTLLSLSAKSVTTPIAIGISESVGGLATITASAVILTGIVGIVFVNLTMKLCRIDDDRIWGFCLGLSAHAIGTARAFERSPVAGAFSSLALCLTGSYSAVFIPLALQWFR
ncbi:LrgB family protein [Litorivivens sp.]|uniref:LrgB family protein n=1 Tax=Litorivivens sp. TaxID=2020868 RepID=UPI003568E22F